MSNERAQRVLTRAPTAAALLRAKERAHHHDHQKRPGEGGASGADYGNKRASSMADLDP